MRLPRLLRIRQQFDVPRLEDIVAETQQQMAGLSLKNRVRSGESVAITAGSRGIANIHLITREIARHFRELGAVPFIVPSMGSHGGGTADGQRSILADYGITEEFVGAEIRSSMETVVVDNTPQGIPVHFDKQAFQADHVFVCGRVKPHTGFAGDIESGLHKMMLIGLGKQAGAYVYHRAIQKYSFAEIIHAVADVVLHKCGVIGGLGIVENAYDQTALLEAVLPQDFLEREKELLRLSKQWMPRLPFDETDLLIVDKIGKNISGTGMDTNIIGRKFVGTFSHLGTDDVACKRVLVRALTEESHGNACGIGLADFTTQQCAEQIDQQQTRMNCITAGHPEVGAMPLTYPCDQEAVQAALQTIGMVEPPQARVMHIADTLQLSELRVSEAYADAIAERDDLSIIEGPLEMDFDSTGQLLHSATA